LCFAAAYDVLEELAVRQYATSMEHINMRKRYRLALLAALTAAVIAISAAVQAPTRVGSERPSSEQQIAGSRAETAFGRESS